jgi:hypothetical protein
MRGLRRDQWTGCFTGNCADVPCRFMNCCVDIFGTLSGEPTVICSNAARTRPGCFAAIARGRCAANGETIPRTLCRLLSRLPTGRQPGCFLCAKRTTTRTTTTIARVFPNHRANCHADILRYGVGRFPPTARQLPGTNRTDSPEIARMIHGTPTGLLRDLLRGLHRQLAGHSRIVAPAFVQPLIGVG